MAKTKSGGNTSNSKYQKKSKTRRPGVHSKKKRSVLKRYKNYIKPYKGKDKK